jgi:hypothetical protein
MPGAGVDEGAASALASLSLADSSLPLWFKPELFLAPEFSPAAYVADLKRYVRRQGCWASGGGSGDDQRRRRAAPWRRQPPALAPLQVPLETLSTELDAHLGALKNKLVEVGAGAMGAWWEREAAAAALLHEHAPAAPHVPAPLLLLPER